MSLRCCSLFFSCLIVLVVFVSDVRGQNVTTVLSGQKLRAFYLESGELVRNPDGVTFGGWIGKLAARLQTDANFTFVETALSANALANTTNVWDGCVLDVYLGNLDVCIGSLWVTTGRELLVSFTSAVRTATFSLITPVQTDDTSNIVKIFIPFDWSLWGVFLGITVFEGLVLWVLESEKSDDFTEIENKAKQVKQSVFLSLFGFLSAGPAHGVRTAAGQITLIGYAFLILVAIASYVANLSAFLTQSSTASPFTSLTYATQHGITVCMQDTLKQAIDGTSTLLTYDSLQTKDVGDNILAGLCAGGVVEDSEFEALQRSDPTYCQISVASDDTLLAVPVAFGITHKFHHPLSLFITQLRFSGEIQAWIEEDKTGQLCDASSDNGGSMTVENMIGLFIISGGATGLALIIYVFKLIYLRRQKKNDNNNSDSNSKDGDEKNAQFQIVKPNGTAPQEDEDEDSSSSLTEDQLLQLITKITVEQKNHRLMIAKLLEDWVDVPTGKPIPVYNESNGDEIEQSPPKKMENGNGHVENGVAYRVRAEAGLIVF